MRGLRLASQMCMGLMMKGKEMLFGRNWMLSILGVLPYGVFVGILMLLDFHRREGKGLPLLVGWSLFRISLIGTSDRLPRASISRLDRFLTSSEWTSSFPNASQIKLFSPILDHCPILLDTEEIDRGPKPLRFNNVWLEDPKFRQLVKEWWDSFEIYGWGGYVISKKLILLK